MSPSLRFPEFNGEWKEFELGDIARVVGGGTPDTNNRRYWNGNIQWFTPSEIGKNKYVSNSLRTISEEGLNSSSAKLLPIGTILLSSRATVGECSINKRECTTNQGFQSLIPKENFLNEFVFYLMQTKRKELIKKSCGSTFLEISANEVRKIKIAVPTRIEQEKISKLLALLDERIVVQNRLIEDLKKLRCAIVEKMFKQSKANGRLGDFIEQVSVRNKNGLYSNVLSVSNKQGFVKQSEQFEDRTVASEDTSNYKIVKRNNFAYNPARINVGSIARLTKFDVGIVSPMYVCFRTKASIIPEYMEAFFTSQQFFYEMMKRLEGSVRLCLSYEGLCNIPVYIPDMNKQIAMGQNISLILSKIGLEIEYLGRLHQQKQYLLRKMFI